MPAAIPEGTIAAAPGAKPSATIRKVTATATNGAIRKNVNLKILTAVPAAVVNTD
jgi:hypothetical protein